MNLFEAFSKARVNGNLPLKESTTNWANAYCKALNAGQNLSSSHIAFCLCGDRVLRAAFFNKYGDARLIEFDAIISEATHLVFPRNSAPTLGSIIVGVCGNY